MLSSINVRFYIIKKSPSSWFCIVNLQASSSTSWLVHVLPSDLRLPEYNVTSFAWGEKKYMFVCFSLASLLMHSSSIPRLTTTTASISTQWSDCIQQSWSVAEGHVEWTHIPAQNATGRCRLIKHSQSLIRKVLLNNLIWLVQLIYIKWIRYDVSFFNYNQNCKSLENRDTKRINHFVNPVIGT